MKKEYEEIVEETTVAEAVEEVVKRPYTLRRLKDSDLMPLLQLLRKLGLKDFKDAFTSANGEKDIEELGKLVVIDIAEMLIDKICSSYGEDIYAFWSGLSGIPVEEIKEMEFGTLPLMIYDTFNEVKDTSFFKVLFKLL
jgi:hypothetical protein